MARSTIAKALKEHGIKPSPERPMSWATFVRGHADLIAAAHCFRTEVWTVRGLVRHFTLFVIDVATRRVHVAGTTANPTSAWMEQMARNLTDCDEGFLTGKRYLILDRDAIFSSRFKSILGDSGVEILLTAYQAPNMNAYAERFVRSIKTECLDQVIFLGRDSLVRAIAEYTAHYHDERSHLRHDEKKQAPLWPRRLSLEHHSENIHLEAPTTRGHSRRQGAGVPGDRGRDHELWHAGKNVYPKGPEIRIDDGHLDVLILGTKPVRDYPFYIFRILTGRTPDILSRFIKVERCVTMRSNVPLPVQADGDMIGMTPLDLELLPGAVTVLVPEEHVIVPS